MSTHTFSIRLDDETLDLIRKQAEHEKRTVGAHISILIDYGIKHYERRSEAARRVDEDIEPKHNKAPETKQNRELA